MIRIAIDGPGGAGKSSVAKHLAHNLSIIYVDTGALYRSIGLFILEKGISPTDRAAVVAQLKYIDLKLRFTDRQILLLNGTDVGDRIRTPEVSMAASAVSAIPEVRAFLLDTQRKIAKKNSVIMDGRDIGTVILPDADLKIFLIASPQARAMRRFKELSAKGVETTYEAVLSEMQVRDTNDSTRDVAPCVPAEDAIILDNSDMTLEQTAQRIEQYLHKKTAMKKVRRSYGRAYRVFAPLIRLLYRVRITGQENLPKTGGFLLCSNHISARDIPLLGAHLSRQLRFLAKEEVFKTPLLRSVARSLGAIPVHRSGADTDAIRRAVETIHMGDCVVIFPQGHRHPKENPADTKVFGGAGMIACRAACPVIPVCIKMKGCAYAPFRRIDMIIGEPISLQDTDPSASASAAYRAASAQIFDRILALGEYRPTAIAAPKTHETDAN